ncbi:hypothetical protein [Kitasatospora albolonga]|uniref:hypothetical protein n=1 Tax=Kitasatospora albolonga TaxID=68173 RepID=UPI00131D250F
MGTQDATFDDTTGHYDQCPQHATPTDPRCYCEGIEKAQQGYYDEPTDMREH